MSGHPHPDELADAAEGLLDGARSAEVAAHTDSCPDCSGTAAALRRVRTTLATAPRPTMPKDVSARLTAALAAEARARASRSGGVRAVGGDPPRRSRPSLGSYAARLPTPKRHRWRGFALAAGVAAVLGAGGVLLGPGTALDDPPHAPVTVATDGLGTTASELLNEGQLQPPSRFSPAAACARRAVDDPITGLTQVRVGRQAALLVVTEGDRGSEAVLVVGCETGMPTRVLSTPLPR